LKQQRLLFEERRSCRLYQQSTCAVVPTLVIFMSHSLLIHQRLRLARSGSSSGLNASLLRS